MALRRQQLFLASFTRAALECSIRPRDANATIGLSRVLMVPSRCVSSPATGMNFTSITRSSDGSENDDPAIKKKEEQPEDREGKDGENKKEDGSEDENNGSDIGPTAPVIRKPSASIMVNNPATFQQKTRDILSSEDVFPDEVPIIPLYRRPLMPGLVTPFTVNDKDFIREVVTKGIEGGGNKYVGLFMVDPSLKEGDRVTSSTDLAQVGCLGKVTRTIPVREGNTVLLISGLHRITLREILEYDPVLRGSIEELASKNVNPQDTMIKAYTMQIVSTIKEIVKLNPFFKEQLQTFLDQVDIHNPAELADFAAALTTVPGRDVQDILETLNVETRLTKVANLLEAELETSKVQMKIQKEMEEKVSKSQRQYFLKEQLKTIKKELGMEQDEKENLISKYTSRLEKKKVPKDADKLIQDEIQKLRMLEPSSSEYNVTRNYLDWLTQLPWGITHKDNLNLTHASKILDKEHYGLEDVKKGILEFIAVGKLRGSVQGKILCLVGPPGVGKTSVGKSIAHALNRKFFRFSVGGMTDIAEIKGHRRTYVGAMPGKLIQCLKATETSNPVVLLDEIDKIGRGYQGDPSSALLEVLDPEQNQNFLDHYLDIPYDLSNVLFVCTANTLETIPRPLLDRMEIINLSGYVADEKMAIARKYLIPDERKSAGLTAQDAAIKEPALKTLIRNYCREPGVRNLKQHIEKIFRKVAYKIVTSEEDRGERPKIEIGLSNLEDFVGKPIFTSDRIYTKTPAGVVTGLAYTPLGGTTLYVESVSDPVGRGSDISITGQLGDVMKESSRIAYVFAKHFMPKVNPENRFFENSYIHIHVPEGATPKDGPSAALGQPVRQKLAMTGEITLTGLVLPIGGVKEKILAAKRSGMKTVIIPEANRKDVEELKPYVYEGLDIYTASSYDDVYKIAFSSGKVEGMSPLELKSQKTPSTVPVDTPVPPMETTETS